MNGAKGFSLVELLCVVVVIMIVAAIAIPNLLTARRSSNEGSTISALRTLHGANVTYASTSGSGNYAGLAATAGPSALNDLLNARLIDGSLGSGTKAGYSFTGSREDATATSPATFYFAANPTTATGIVATGTKRFGVATDGVLKYDGTAATLATPMDAATIAAAEAIPGSN